MAKYDSFSAITIETSSLYDEGEVYFETSDGYILNLDDGSDIQFMAGRANHLMPPYSYVSTQVPAEHGERLRRVYIEKRTIDVPILVLASSYQSLLNKQQELALFLDSSSLETESYLIFKDRNSPTLVDPDAVTPGTQAYRYLKCVYAGGMEGAQLGDSEFIIWSRHVLSFQAFDPFFYNYRSDNIDFPATTSASPLLPFMPLQVEVSGLSETETIANYGYDVFPTFEIEGPFTYLRIDNLTTSRYIILSYSCATGETITIDTTIGNKTITSDLNGNLLDYMDPTSSFWDLKTGDNSVKISMTGDNADTTAVLKYRPRFLTMG